MSGISRERREQAFNEASSFDQFVNSMQVNQETFLANYDGYQLSEAEKSFFATALSEPIEVLILAHDWCGDVVANLPLFGKIEKETGKLHLHILPRDPNNTDIAAAYPHQDGSNHIPTYVFFNQAGDELGVFIERPDVITRLMANWSNSFYDNQPQFEIERGKPIGELSPETRRELLAYLKKRRAEVRPQEQAAIVQVIKQTVLPTGIGS